MAKAFLYKPNMACRLLDKYGSALQIYGSSDEQASIVDELLREAFSCNNIKWAEEEIDWCAQ